MKLKSGKYLVFTFILIINNDLLHRRQPNKIIQLNDVTFVKNLSYFNFDEISCVKNYYYFFLICKLHLQINSFVSCVNTKT